MVAKIDAKRYTLEEYLELDRNSEERLEYWDGEIFAMSGGSEEHDQIAVNLTFRLRAKLEGCQCRVFSSNMRVKVPRLLTYRSRMCPPCAARHISRRWAALMF